MFLSDLEIIGFKSFGLKTKFKFSEGITCLVGPNGCGKSNIVDAIRWVLGEQKSNVLRSDNMENIIFNGTKHRKQSGISEVILTIENNKHLLPSEFENVSVARRLNRNGDSKYLLNKANCRLKDINNLFMDTGMGPDSYSVIELKMVENLLSGRNEDRKNLLEEAAGITKYKVRRKESERKLKRVEEDLERVEDIVVEVRKNTNSLSRQAAKTKRYNKFTEELKEKEIQLYSINIKIFKEKKEELEELTKTQSKSLSEINLKIGSLKEDILNKNKTKSAIDIKNKDYRVEISTYQAKLSDSKQLNAVSSVKEKNLKRDIQRFEEETKHSEDSNKRREEKVESLDKEIQGYELEKGELGSKLTSSDNEITELKKTINSTQNEIDSTNRKINDFRNNISEINYKKKRHDENLNRLSSTIEDYNQKIDHHSERLNELESEQKSNSNKLDKLKAEKEDVESKIKSNEDKIERIKSELSKLVADYNDENLKLKENKRELNFWESSIDKSSNSGYLLSNKDWNDKSYSTLAENLGIDEKFNLAYQTVLSKKSDAIILEDDSKIWSAKKILEDAKKGKQAFILNHNELESTPESNIDGVLGFISELPRVTDEIRSYLRKTFSRIAIVEDLDNAKEILQNENIEAVVSLNGDYISKHGDYLVGSPERSRSDFGKKEKIAKLKEDVQKLDKVVSKLEQQIEQKKLELNSISNKELENSLRSIESSLKSQENIISKSQIEINSITNKIDLFKENLKNAQEEIAELEKKDISLDEINKLNDAIKDTEIKLSSQLDILNKTKSKLEQSTNFHQELNIKKINIENQLNNIFNEKRNIQNSIDATKRRLIKSEKDFFRNNDELKQVISDKSKSSEDIIDITEKLEATKTQSEVLNSQLKDITADLDGLESNRNELQVQADKISSSFHKSELELTEVKTKIESILVNANEKYDLSLEKLNNIEADTNVDELIVTIKDLKEKLASIGSVNFMALDDYEKENQRLIFYETQIQDLTTAKSTLVETITEINKKAEELLTTTFDKVRTNFKELFQTLFSEEGECDIKLEGENPLDADLAIMAKPPGKKPHSIDMLSGGEKTLTAIALLFAIYLVKPSPFCILDEVDAPLDDNNIGRFVRLIKKFSNNTQFLVVTHNKKTMEAADNLYGITQQEEGLSKIVSVQLNRKN